MALFNELREDLSENLGQKRGGVHGAVQCHPPFLDLSMGARYVALGLQPLATPLIFKTGCYPCWQFMPSLGR